MDELVADDFVDHSPPPDVSADKAGMKQIVQMFRTAFPDLKLTVEDTIAEGDKVAVRVVTSGTHKGELMGIPPTGQTVTFNEQHWVRLVDGKITEHWGGRGQPWDDATVGRRQGTLASVCESIWMTAG